MLMHLLHGRPMSHAKWARLQGPHADETFALPPTRLIGGPSREGEAVWVSLDCWDNCWAPSGCDSYIFSGYPCESGREDGPGSSSRIVRAPGPPNGRWRDDEEPDDWSIS